METILQDVRSGVVFGVGTIDTFCCVGDFAASPVWKTMRSSSGTLKAEMEIVDFPDYPRTQ
jgi:hypothetical protein